MIVAPNYYKDFKCIAQKCKNSCCIGWEIDIDSETLEIYQSIKGDFGERLKNSINFSAETPHFITDKNSRCPFLNKNGLCDIITEFGEDGLCQICYDHPRFRNFFGDIEEIGLGLCCEAAAELILKNENKFSLILLDEYSKNNTDLNAQLSIFEGVFKSREELFSIFQNRELPLTARIKKAAEIYKIIPLLNDTVSLIKKYRALERLDPKWDDFLTQTENKNYNLQYILSKAEKKIPLPTEQLLCYFSYRYFASESVKENAKGAVNFILEATYFCLLLCISVFDEPNLANLTEICRRFSLEVEYSEENIALLLNPPTKTAP